MDTWRGHFPITSFVLLALLKKKTENDATGLSRAEQVLFTACQFWAAVATRELAGFMQSNPVPRLLLAFEAFSEIGAVRIASALRVVIRNFPQMPSPRWHVQHALELEVRLLDTDESVDQLIAQFASEHLSQDSSERQRNGVEPRSRSVYDKIRDAP